jgi:hypothetical protein
MTHQGATVAVVNHDVPTDPVALAAKRKEQAASAVASAKAKVVKAEAHLKAAQEALAQALAEQKGLN